MSANPSNKKALDPKVTADNGGDFAGLMQPNHKVAFQAIGAAFSQAEVTALRDALIVAGIMKSS